MSFSDNSRRGGQPSTTTPTPPPCDSPQVVIRNKWPKVFAMGEVWGKGRGGSNLVEAVSKFKSARSRRREEAEISEKDQPSASLPRRLPILKPLLLSLVYRKFTVPPAILFPRR